MLPELGGLLADVSLQFTLMLPRWVNKVTSGWIVMKVCRQATKLRAPRTPQFNFEFIFSSIGQFPSELCFAHKINTSLYFISYCRRRTYIMMKIQKEVWIQKDKDPRHVAPFLISLTVLFLPFLTILRLTIFERNKSHCIQQLIYECCSSENVKGCCWMLTDWPFLTISLLKNLSYASVNICCHNYNTRYAQTCSTSCRGDSLRNTFGALQ